MAKKKDLTEKDPTRKQLNQETAEELVMEALGMSKEDFDWYMQPDNGKTFECQRLFDQKILKLAVKLQLEIINDWEIQPITSSRFKNAKRGAYAGRTIQPGRGNKKP